MSYSILVRAYQDILGPPASIPVIANTDSGEYNKDCTCICES